MPNLSGYLMTFFHGEHRHHGNIDIRQHSMAKPSHPHVRHL